MAASKAVSLGRRLGLLDEEVRVSARGGELRVNWGGEGRRGEDREPFARGKEEAEHMWLTGPAEASFVGHVEV